jgi:hypothetical protein
MNTLPPGLAGWVAADQMNRQKQAYKLQELQGILGLQQADRQMAMQEQTQPLQLRMLQAQVQGAENPSPVMKDMGGYIGILHPRTFQEIGRLPKTASPDTVLKEQGATDRHGQASGSTLSTLAQQRELHGIPSASALLSAQTQIAGMNRPQFNAELGGWLTPPPVGMPGIMSAPRAPQGQMPSAMDSAPRMSPNMQVPPQVQAQRDAEAARIRTAEGNGGAGMVPTTSVVPGFTPVPGLAGRPPKQTAGQNEADKEFAKEYVAFKASGGYADIEKNLGQLAQASQTLAKDNTLTGPIRGLYPDWVRSITNPTAVATKEKVQEVAQRNLRLILGAQFTEKEGERLISRVYNDRLSPEENKSRVDALMLQIQEAAKAKQSASEYFEKNGTLTGWTGRLPKFDDFMPKDRQSDRASDILNQADRIIGGR